MPKQRLLISNFPTSSMFFFVPSPLFLICLFLSLRLLETCLAEDWIPQCELALFGF